MEIQNFDPKKVSLAYVYRKFQSIQPPLASTIATKTASVFAVGGGRGANSRGGVSLLLSPDFPFLMSSVHFFPRRHSRSNYTLMF